MNPPAEEKDTTFLGFVLRADYGKLRALCDRYLNAPLAGTDIEYRPLLGLATLTVVRLPFGRSQDPVDRDKGYLCEREASFWVPVVRGRMRDGRFAPDEVAWFIPYIWVDSAPGMADGREVYGFPKESAEFVMPGRPTDAARYAVSTWVIPKYSPDSVCKLLPLLEVTRVDGGMDGALRATCATIGETADAVLARVGNELFEGGEHLPLPTWPLLRSTLADLEHGIVRTVLLKQFRDCQVPGKACYQAIVETPCRTTKLRAAGFVDGVWRVRIQEYDSHPIVAELGLEGADLEAPLSFWVNFDFVAEVGTPIVEHTVSGAP